MILVRAGAGRSIRSVAGREERHRLPYGRGSETRAERETGAERGTGAERDGRAEREGKEVVILCGGGCAFYYFFG
jgi:hypothetical protein